jgi:hypothetical protein
MERDYVHYVDALHQKTNQIVMAHMQNLVSKQKHQKSKSVIKFTRHFFIFHLPMSHFIPEIVH